MIPHLTERQKALREKGQKIADALQKEAEWISKSFGRDDLNDKQFRRLEAQSRFLGSIAGFMEELQEDWEEIHKWVLVYKQENDGLRKDIKRFREDAKLHRQKYGEIFKGTSAAYKQLSLKIREIEQNHGKLTH